MKFWPRKLLFILFIVLCVSPVIMPRRAYASINQEVPKPVIVQINISAQQAMVEDCVPGTGSLHPIGPVTKTQFNTQNAHKQFIPLLHLATRACTLLTPFQAALALLQTNNEEMLPTILNGATIIQAGDLASSQVEYELALPDPETINSLVVNPSIPNVTTGFKKLLGATQFTPTPIETVGISQEEPIAPEDFLELTGEKKWSQRMLEIDRENKAGQIEAALRPNDFIYRDPYSDITRTSANQLCPHLSPVVYEIKLLRLFPFPTLTSQGFVTRWWWAIEFTENMKAQCPALNGEFFISDLETWIAIGVEKNAEIDAKVNLDNMFKATIWGLQPNGQLVPGEAAFTYVESGTVIVLIMVVIYATIAAPAYYLMAFTID